MLHVKVFCYCSHTEWCKIDSTFCDCPCVNVLHFKNSLTSVHHNGYTVHISHGYSYIQVTTWLHAHKSLEPPGILAPHKLKFKCHAGFPPLNV
jgi:hypothetical protein